MWRNKQRDSGKRRKRVGVVNNRNNVAKSPGFGRVDRLDFLGAPYPSNGGSQGIIIGSPDG